MIKERDGWACQLSVLGIEHGCTGTDEDLTIHHIDPKANGGSEHPYNLITICSIGQNWLHGGRANSQRVLSFMSKFQQIAKTNTEAAINSGNDIGNYLKWFM